LVEMSGRGDLISSSTHGTEQFAMDDTVGLMLRPRGGVGDVVWGGNMKRKKGGKFLRPGEK